MKRKALSILSLLSLFLMGSALAQTVKVHADIPFNFSVGSKTLPAGEYEIKSIGGNTRTLLIRASSGEASMIVNSNSAIMINGAEKTKVVFNRYGSQYFLTALWTQGSTDGFQLVKSSREKELARELAMHRADRIEVVASLY
jgi:hypothetical protein